MTDLVNNPTVQAGLAIVVLCVLIASGFYLVSIFRDYAADDRDEAIDMLANLREMHKRGDISDEEFRIIEAKTDFQRSRETAG